MMADKLDWTTSLGQAYVNQSTDVMDSVQRLRGEARQAGNLEDTPEMQVVDSGGEIELWPAQPEYIYVPVYNPAFVYYRPPPLFFHPRFLLGAWLNFGFDWGGHRVFYHGWEGGHGGWIDRSRSHVHFNDIYVNRVYRNVPINRGVIDRHVNYGGLNRYDDVHPRTTFDNFRGRERVGRPVTTPATRVTPVTPVTPVRPVIPVTPVPSPSFIRPPSTTVPVTRTPEFRRDVPNKIIERNIDTRDPRIDEYRGRMPAQVPQVHQPAAPAFTPDRSSIDTREASRRGEVSRARVASPPPPPPPTPAPRHKEEEKKKH